LLKCQQKLNEKALFSMLMSYFCRRFRVVGAKALMLVFGSRMGLLSVISAKFRVELL
jgi:hypothetical protein